MNVRHKAIQCALAFALLFGSTGAWAQAPENWFTKDASADGVNGTSADQAHATLLKGKQGRTVIVAVIDSGVDIEHEDLQGKIWVNADEIPGNGIDDDKNGYIDDVNGWNFIGGKDGRNVAEDTYEITRLYAKYKAMYENADPAKLSGSQKKEYAKYLEYKAEVESKLEEAQAGLAQMEQYKSMFGGALDAVEEALGGKPLTSENLEALGDDSQPIVIGKNLLKEAAAEGGSIADVRSDLMQQLQRGEEYYGNQVKYSFNPDFNPRTIVGDNYADPYEIGYGNNDVEGPDASHGTHVAGIIAAVRGNGIGMDGIADNVLIMSIRCVPDGDERDKDVANAIRYAVDNGAEIINMSFGKAYSWNKDVVDEAIRYAVENDVLLVHAAGNSSQDNDVAPNFPNDRYGKRGLFSPKYAKTWLEIGAASWKSGDSAVGSFSNYGKKNVDLFSPGVDIYSTIPGNEYDSFNGTSMAAPAAAGVATLLRSYYPELSAQQVKDIMMASVTPSTQKVKKPGTEDLVPYSSLSVAGGTVNAVSALKMAAQTKGKRKAKFLQKEGA